MRSKSKKALFLTSDMLKLRQNIHLHDKYTNILQKDKQLCDLSLLHSAKIIYISLYLCTHRDKQLRLSA